MIWIRIFVMLFVILMAIYYGMFILQCFTSWFKFTNREITFERALIPFYYWIASTDEPSKQSSELEDEEDDLENEAELKVREKEFNDNFTKKIKSKK